MNHETAYILGLFVGGGTISSDTFIIKLPFKKWGADPRNMRSIARDILTKICDKFQRSFSFPVTYEIGNREWSIIPIGNPDISELRNTLAELRLPTSGFLLNNADLTHAKDVLSGIAVENFLTGIFDARASLTLSHRRFTTEAPVVSVEIPGSTKNFLFVMQFCSWLTEMGSVTDQILYNHPNQHSASDPNYSGWKKGFKIRFLARSFIARHSFAFQAKAIDVESLEELQVRDEQERCDRRAIRKPSPVCIHSQLDSDTLPDVVRNKLFFHYFHFCGQLGCPFAPIDEIRKIVANYRNYIFFLPRLEKGSISEIHRDYEEIHDRYFSSKSIISMTMSVSEILSDRNFQTYHETEQSLAFIFSPELNGKRHVGSMEIILRNNADEIVTVFFPEETTNFPVMLQNSVENRAAIISAVGSNLNQELINENITLNGFEVNVRHE